MPPMSPNAENPVLPWRISQVEPSRRGCIEPSKALLAARPTTRDLLTRGRGSDGSVLPCTQMPMGGSAAGPLAPNSGQAEHLEATATTPGHAATKVEVRLPVGVCPPEEARPVAARGAAARAVSEVRAE